MTDKPFIPVDCAVFTVSDTRTPENDTSGDTIVAGLTQMGHRVVRRAIIADDISLLRTAVSACIAEPDLDVVVLTGGTGITRRDQTPEAIAPLATKHIPGFGELFRWLSYADIGSSTIQSRADAWLCDSTLVFALPGSTGAVRLAFDKILVEQLDARHRPCNFIQLLNRIK
jgi:molybdenum cofactor biosynthesis protein B